MPVYMFVIWHKGLPELDVALDTIRERFTVLRQYDVTWRPRDYVKNFAAFYGWKSWSMWWGKKRRSGTGVFRVVMVRDDSPKYGTCSDDLRERLKLGEVPDDLLENENVAGVKLALRRRMRHSNVIHAAINEAETRHNLMALTGETLEEFLAGENLDGGIRELRFDRPMPYRPYKYIEVRGKGPQYFDGIFKGNRVAIFLLPRCGVPTIFSFSFRLFGLFSFAFCIGTVKMGFSSSYK